MNTLFVKLSDNEIGMIEAALRLRKEAHEENFETRDVRRWEKLLAKIRKGTVTQS